MGDVAEQLLGPGEEEVIKSLPKVTFEPGQVVFKEGEIGAVAYCVIRGRIDLHSKLNGKDKHICTIKDGELFGEMAALIENGRRLATATASEPTECYAISRDLMTDQIDKAAPIVRALIRILVSNVLAFKYQI